MSETEIDGLLGLSMLSAAKKISYYVNRNKPVLVTGETGTGKSWLAKIVAGKFDDFIEISCVDTNDNLFRSSLFGHKKGAFTGATENSPGVIENAKNGVVILDEIGDLPKETQGALLRLIQERKYRILGGIDDKETDVRFIAVTNKPDKLRLDLDARFVKIQIPSLNKRRDELPSMIREILIKLSVNSITAEAMICLMSYKWKTNFRQLETVLEGVIAEQVINSTSSFNWGKKLKNEVVVTKVELKMLPPALRIYFEDWIEEGKPSSEYPSPFEKIETLEIGSSNFCQEALKLYVDFSKHIISKPRDPFKFKTSHLDKWFHTYRKTVDSKSPKESESKPLKKRTLLINMTKGETETFLLTYLSKFTIDQVKHLYWESIGKLGYSSYSAGGRKAGVSDKTVKDNFEKYGITLKSE